MTDTITTRLAALGMELAEVEAYRRERLRRGPDVDGLTADAALAAVVRELEQYDAECVRLTELMERAETAEAALAVANRFINRFIVHDGEARPYSVRDLQLELERAEADRDQYRDVLLSKHGGEPLALLDELDIERARVEVAEAALAEVEQQLVEVTGRLRQQVADLKRIVGQQEQELHEAEHKLREHEATERRYLSRIRELRVRGGGGT